MNTIEEVTIYENLELSLRHEVWRLDLSPLQISLGRLFPTVTVREESMLVPHICVYEASICGCLCEVVGDWDVNKVENYPMQNGDSGLRTMTF